MVSSQELYNICLKTSLFEAKVYYSDFKKLFLPRKPRNLDVRRINCTAKEAKAIGTIFQVISALVRIYVLSFYRYLEANGF